MRGKIEGLKMRWKHRRGNELWKRNQGLIRKKL